MKKSLKALFTVAMVAISGFFFFSCEEANELSGTWNTIGLEKDNVVQEIAISNLTFTPEGKTITVSGESGVNLLSGTVKLGKKKIKFVNVGSTRMMGDPAAMEFENMFLETISYADSYTLENNTLTITASSKNLKLTLRK